MNLVSCHLKREFRRPRPDSIIELESYHHNCKYLFSFEPQRNQMELIQTIITELMSVFTKVQDKQVVRFQVCGLQYTVVIIFALNLT